MTRTTLRPVGGVFPRQKTVYPNKGMLYDIVCQNSCEAAIIHISLGEWGICMYMSHKIGFGMRGYSKDVVPLPKELEDGSMSTLPYLDGMEEQLPTNMVGWIGSGCIPIGKW